MLSKLFKQKTTVLIYIFTFFLMFSAVYLLSYISKVKDIKKVQRTVIKKKTNDKRMPTASIRPHKYGQPDSAALFGGEKIDKKDIPTKFGFNVKLPSGKAKELTGNLKTVIARKPYRGQVKSDYVNLFFDKEKIEIVEQLEWDGYVEPGKWKDLKNAEWVNDYQFVNFNGTVAATREPGIGETDNGTPSPSVVIWSDGKVDYQVYGNGVSVKDLLKIARSLK